MATSRNDGESVPTPESPNASAADVDTAYLFRIIRRGCGEARRIGHPFVGTEHLLLATLALLTPEAARLVEAFGIATDDVRGLSIKARHRDDDPHRITNRIRRYGYVRVGSTNHRGADFRVWAPFTPTALQVVEAAKHQAESRSQLSVRAEHILIALLEHTESAACNSLRALVFDHAILRQSLEARIETPAATESAAEAEEVWVPNAEELVDSIKQVVVDQDNAVNAVVAAAVLQHTAAQTGITRNKPNILLRGPTGVGKTYTIEQLAQQFRLPFATVNCAAVTPPGYVGGDIEAVFWDLYVRANRNIDLAERGIIFLDEIDKLATGPVSRNRETQLSIPVQHTLNRIIEGDSITAAEGGAVRSSRDDQVTLRTERMWFIGAGAFSGLDDLPSRRTRHGALFRSSGEHLFDDTDLIDYGLMPELVGRFRLMVELAPLSVKALTRILSTGDEPPIALYSSYFEDRDVKLDVCEEARKQIAEYAFQRQLGARPLSGLLHVVLEPEILKTPPKGTVLRISAEIVRQRISRRNVS